MMTEGCQLIEATVSQELGYISFHTLKLPKQQDQNLGVALMDLVEELIGINTLETSAGFDQKRAWHFRRR